MPRSWVFPTADRDSANLTIRWSEVRVLPQQPISFPLQDSDFGHQVEKSPRVIAGRKRFEQSSAWNQKSAGGRGSHDDGGRGFERQTGSNGLGM